MPREELAEQALFISVRLHLLNRWSLVEYSDRVGFDEHSTWTPIVGTSNIFVAYDASIFC